MLFLLVRSKGRHQQHPLGVRHADRLIFVEHAHPRRAGRDDAEAVIDPIRQEDVAAHRHDRASQLQRSGARRVVRVGPGLNGSVARSVGYGGRAMRRAALGVLDAPSIAAGVETQRLNGVELATPPPLP